MQSHETDANHARAYPKECAFDNRKNLPDRHRLALGHLVCEGCRPHTARLESRTTDKKNGEVCVQRRHQAIFEEILQKNPILRGTAIESQTWRAQCMTSPVSLSLS